MTSPSTAPKDAIRDAATVVVVRRGGAEPRVLMGQRGANAAFMPSKFVFPGGAVDAADKALARLFPAPGALCERLAREADAATAGALALTAVRELWEETGLALARPGDPLAGVAPEGWESFFAAARRPALDGLDFIFRAITPPGRPRRFDARFFLVDADDLEADPDDFSGADAELSHLGWLTLAEARRLDLPFITEVVLAEVEARLAEPDPSRPAPFFHHDGGRSFITAL